MSSWAVPLSDVIIGEDEIAAVSDVYRSGWLSMGPRTQALEEELGRYVGANHAIAVSSCTAALHLMCLAAGFGPGDEVIVPSLTFVATVNAIAYTGATPIFADIASPLEPWISADATRAAITQRTRGVMTMTYGGHAGETAAVASICADSGLLLLEDTAHALGTRLNGRHLGTFGKAGAFSFFSNKNLAVGEGGAVVTDDPDFAASVRLLRSHGMTAVSWDRHSGHASGYDVVSRGYNYRIDDPRAELATMRLRKLDAQNQQRAALDRRYRELLGGSGVECPLAPSPGMEPAHHVFTILLPEGTDRDRFRAVLTERRIQTSVHYPPVHRFSVYQSGAPELPLTDDYANRTVTLPLFPHLTHDQQDLVVEAVAAGLADTQRPV